MPDVPALSYFGGNAGNGEGMLISGLVLSIRALARGLPPSGGRGIALSEAT
jgi:hypothetical protein